MLYFKLLKLIILGKKKKDIFLLYLLYEKFKNGLAVFFLIKLIKQSHWKNLPTIHSSAEDELNYIFRVLTIYA